MLKTNKRKNGKKHIKVVKKVIYKCTVCGARYTKDDVIEQITAEGCRCGALPDDIVDVYKTPKIIEEDDDDNL